MRAIRRALPLWLVLAAAYAVAALVASGGTTGPEAHRLLGAESIVSDGDVDLRDEYAQHAWRDFHDGPLRPAAAGLTEGRLVEPVTLGFELLVAPAYWLGGATGVRLLLGAIAALAFCLAAALGRALVPDPWPARAALVTGLSPPALGAATAIAPEMAGAACLAAAAVLALRVRREPRLAWAFWGAALVAALPWLATKLLAPAAVVAAALSRWLRRRQRGLAGFIALEVALTSAVVYVTVDDRLFGGLTPHDVARGGATGASGLADHLARAPRLVTSLVGIDAGLLRWAPFAALAGVALWLLWRSRRDRLAVAVADQIDVEVSAAFLALIAGAVWLTAVFLAPDLEAGARTWSQARQLVPALPVVAALAAWGLRFAPRAGAILAAVTLAESVWLVATS
ncbi:MAG TPA: hypothetical protein VFT50_11005 [Baekduia sp.]|nr:hypothetical protein [Baekduia sp.]